MWIEVSRKIKCPTHRGTKRWNCTVCVREMEEYRVRKVATLLKLGRELKARNAWRVARLESRNDSRLLAVPFQPIDGYYSLRLPLERRVWT